MNKEARRHHYIPQFILKNFVFDKKNNVKYYDSLTKAISIKNTRDIFVEKDLYRDEINNKLDPTRIEKDFSKYESEVSLIFKKIIYGKDILITKQEYDSLLLFLAILGFRSRNVKERYEEIEEQNKDFFLMYQEDGNLNSFWKRNIISLLKCRSLDEVLKSKEIDDVIKNFMYRDIIGVYGKYIVVLEKRGNEDFCIGDTYPCCITGDNAIPIYDYYPISPNRIIILAGNGVIYAPKCIKLFSDSNLKTPVDLGNGLIKIHVTNVYQNEILAINKDIIKNSNIGIVFKDENNISLLNEDE